MLLLVFASMASAVTLCRAICMAAEVLRGTSLIVASQTQKSILESHLGFRV